jgi:putative membrane protein
MQCRWGYVDGPGHKAGEYGFAPGNALLDGAHRAFLRQLGGNSRVGLQISPQSGRIHMPKITVITAALLLAGVSVGFAQTEGTEDTMKPSAAEDMVDATSFVKKAAAANEFGIRSSELAQQKASAEDVKAFATQMIEDHTKAGEELKAALSQGETTSAVPEPSSPEAAMLKELEGATGEGFQVKYISMQAKVHREAVALFQTYAQSGDDPALKEFAKKILPALQQHEEHVKELQAAH